MFFIPWLTFTVALIALVMAANLLLASKKLAEQQTATKHFQVVGYIIAVLAIIMLIASAYSGFRSHCYMKKWHKYKMQMMTTGIGPTMGPMMQQQPLQGPGPMMGPKHRMQQPPQGPGPMMQQQLPQEPGPMMQQPEQPTPSLQNGPQPNQSQPSQGPTIQIQS